MSLARYPYFLPAAIIAQGYHDGQEVGNCKPHYPPTHLNVRVFVLLFLYETPLLHNLYRVLYQMPRTFVTNLISAVKS